ncbi:hypothetical protein LEP1GSC061_0089 [Leptospira wolffii serovar Khorat str. Khorat-H2]|nr:hypothetical protein LEP1GSC061_1018 [Leptospira wolffii serovar Khorat str. Khorat-H2]EPG66467.1 hypothetical protein LEP1GSC061_0994 [Leptospira wolffii serovar Khorat str. Khorat-H2]EPG68277.1 hypothetical protein LEP1GSC061_0089 [Leptospira wolffii serovar Khorat str. Khorat-H2]
MRTTGFFQFVVDFSTNLSRFTFFVKSYLLVSISNYIFYFTFI